MLPSVIQPEVELLDYMVVLFLIFWETSIMLFVVAAPIYISTISVQELSFCHIFTNPFNLLFLEKLNILTIVKLYLSVVLICISLILLILIIFSATFWTFVHFLGENIYLIPQLIFELDYFCYWVLWLYTSLILTLIRNVICRYFL